jgi:hypothetical protein
MVRKFRKSRRSFLKGVGIAGGSALAFPHIWIPGTARATQGRGTAKHLIYIRLSGGFRFPTGFNADVAEEFNPFGSATGVASGTEWGPSALLGRDAWRVDDMLTLGMQSVPSICNDITVLPCIDHEPLSGSADGNHQTGLERYLTGFVNGPTGLFTMINYGLREKVAAAAAQGETILPAISMGDGGIGRGSGKYAAYRPPVLSGSDLDRFGFSVDEVLPPWARSMADAYDQRHRDRQNLKHYPTVDAYIQSREATKAYSDIFSSDPLRIDNGSTEPFDGISNRELEQVFGTNGTAQNLRLALRLFHYGCPAVYMDQGGYDYHSDEEMNLPPRFDELNRIISGLNYALKRMEHPEGGSYWDHTMVVFGSEFSRTTRGGRFNSARGSDHGGDYATRWMSMPFMGGPFSQVAGRSIGSTASADLSPEGKIFSYRATFKTLMDALDCDHEEFFPADEAFDDLFV